MKVTNYEEFKQIIKNYEEITVDQIELAEEHLSIVGELDQACLYGRTVMQFMTGYGTCECVVCAPITGNCVNGCIFASKGCNCSDDPTYTDIGSASNPEELFLAIQNRITYLKTLLNG